MRTSGKRIILGLLTVLLACGAVAARAEETTEQRDARMGWWREAKFGMFIHWGLYAIPAGVWKGQEPATAGEWLMFGAQIPPADYEPLLGQFNPIQFNAAEWVRLAKEAGMKYIVITSKHHDGFALFDSQISDYDVMATPFRRDIMRELADECHKQGIRICWYHSILDWHHPDYLPRGEGSPRPWDTRPTEGHSLDRYLEYMNGQLRELLTNYGDIGILWFDGGWEHTPEELHSQEVVNLIRGLQPNIIINDRIRIPQDYDTPEQHIPDTGIPGRDWETCMTMNDTWGFKTNDHNWKSTETLLRNLVDIVSKGGNYLLNVGPTAEGLIPGPSVERLAEVGRWMAANSESIYGTTASPFRGLTWGRCTVKPGKLYLHVFHWPANGELLVPGLNNMARRAYLLSDPNKLTLRLARRGEDVAITLPPAAPDALDSVVVLDIDGAPDVLPFAVRADDQGRLELKASDATVDGQTARYEEGEGKDNIGFWTNAADSVHWEVRIDKPGVYNVDIMYACDAATAGSAYAITVAGQELAATVEPTANWTDFQTRRIGTAQIDKPGRYKVVLRPTSLTTAVLMTLKVMSLTPA